MMLQNLPHTEMGRKCLLELRCHVLNAVTIIRLKTVVKHWSSMKDFKGMQLFGIVACLCSVKNEIWVFLRNQQDTHPWQAEGLCSCWPNEICTDLVSNYVI